MLTPMQFTHLQRNKQVTSRHILCGKAAFLLMAVTLGMALSAGCQRKEKTEEPQSVYLCELPPDYKAGVMNYMSGILSDPYSAVYQFGQPKKGRAKVGERTVVGWIIPTKISSKNVSGAYAGWKDCFCMIFENDDGEIQIVTVAAESVSYFD
jgi:hypothetical protein